MIVIKLSNKRLIISAFVILLIFFITISLVVLKYFQEELNNQTGEKLSIIETFKAVATFNFDSELEQELKEIKMKKKINNVTIFYDEEQNELIPLTIKTLEWADETVYEVIGNYDKKPVDLMFMNLEEIDRFSELVDVSGFYTDFDKIIGIHVYQEDIENIMQKKETPLYFFQKSIMHEYGHFATYRKIDEIGVSPSEFPQWFLEGIAEYIGNDKTIVEYESFQFEWLPLQQISGGNGWQESRFIEHADPYLQSYFTINYLLKVYGSNVLMELMEKTKMTNDFNKALEQVSGKKIVEFEEDIISYYK
ncbi:hypothetical protein WQ54_31215 [Bacillus sp. SA1-12]|uniref:hypothetical protein n=1 Tax=Bacillus sp. SA1-12 TaxID=1455638 RepID=UPI0006272E76|nr:hypothetical protein [Bacillus sp. SA1-12]KKI88484.1 hypothetical protein WQ54_31215 [Bacillus sp. SA1-12]